VTPAMPYGQNVHAGLEWLKSADEFDVYITAMIKTAVSYMEVSYGKQASVIKGENLRT